MRDNVKEIIKDIQDNEREAATDLNNIPYKARASRAIIMRQACERLPVLLSELKVATIPTRLVAVFPAGSASVTKQVADFLKENGGVVINVNEWYEKMADAIEPSFAKDRFFSTQQFAYIMSEVRVMALQLGYDRMNPVNFDSTMEVKCYDVKASTAHIKGIVRKALGDTMNVQKIAKELIETVLREGLDAKQIPVLVIGAQSLEEKTALTPLFIRSVDHNFSNTFAITKLNIAKVFKDSQKGNDATSGDNE
jgi:hypothetical protein